MKIYLHDGSFEGLLSALYEAFCSKEKPYEICFEKDYVPNIVTIPIFVVTNLENAGKVSNAIEKKISTTALERLIWSFYRIRWKVVFPYTII